MPRPTNFIAFVRNLVREQVQEAVQGLLGVTARPRKKRADGGAGVEDRDDHQGRRLDARAGELGSWGRARITSVQFVG